MRSSADADRRSAPENRPAPLLLLAALLLFAVACGGRGVEQAPAPRDPEKAKVIRFWDLFREATDLRMKGDCPAAVEKYREALALDPRHEDSLYYSGQCEREMKRFAAARRSWARLLEVNPASARGHQALGALLASPDEEAPMDLEEAEAHFRRAHEINGEETGPMVRLGEVLIVRGNAAEARGWLESAIRTNPRSVEAAFLAGYLRWEGGDREGARNFYLRAVRAGQADAPVKGVLSEGDRKTAPVPGAPGPERPAAPPLQEPMGTTLFGRFSAPLREGAASPPRENPPPDLDGIYTPVREFAHRLSRRAGPSAGTVSPGK